MPQLIFTYPDGRQEPIEAAAGTSVMAGATRGGMDAILAECGGNAMCATCHVYVDEDWADRLPPLSDDEDALLDGAAAERRPTSRLSCQITVTPDLDGLILTLPERQV